jgi:hypothetical protein
MENDFGTGIANRLINAQTCADIGYEHDAQHDDGVLHNNLLF